jgi:hypothetical protein
MVRRSISRGPLVKRVPRDEYQPVSKMGGQQTKTLVLEDRTPGAANGQSSIGRGEDTSGPRYLKAGIGWLGYILDYGWTCCYRQAQE